VLLAQALHTKGLEFIFPGQRQQIGQGRSVVAVVTEVAGFDLGGVRVFRGQENANALLPHRGEELPVSVSLAARGAAPRQRVFPRFMSVSAS
jgi:hypothetical protein